MCFDQVEPISLPLPFEVLLRFVDAFFVGLLVGLLVGLFVGFLRGFLVGVATGTVSVGESVLFVSGGRESEDDWLDDADSEGFVFLVPASFRRSLSLFLFQPV